MKVFLPAVLVATLLSPVPAAENLSTLVLSARPVHLRSGDMPEWDQFASQPLDGKRLDLHFSARTNSREATLFIRQEDVKQDWGVELNGKRLGKLFLMEADLVHTINIPTGGLREGTNLLSIIPPKENDDIVLQEIRIDSRSRNDAIHQSTLVLNVRDATGDETLPCRVTITDAHDTLAPLLAITNAPPQEALPPPLALRPGVIYTGSGKARVGLPAGDYTVYASRGFEWSVATQKVHIATGQAKRVMLRLRHEVSTPGLVSCDTHVHTFTHSGHGDATIDERMLTLAGEGIELPIATDHNFYADYSEAARRMRVTNSFTPVRGNEVTTSAGHFNIFPVEATAAPPDFHIIDWPMLMNELRATPGVRVVVLNHPRNIHNNFQPFAATNYNNVTGENKRGAEFSFDAIELMNSSAQQSDFMLVYRDWFALLNHGYRITGVGSSDCHDVSRYIVGQGRTYIVCADDNPARIDVAAACSNLLAGRVLVSMGLLTEITVDGKFGVGDLATGLGEQLRVNIRVLGPSWVMATNVALFANGSKIWETTIRETSRCEKANIEQSISRPAHDVHLIAIATGPGVTAPFWEIPRAYQPTSPHWDGRVIGSTNPIWLDADGDGKFTSARAYAGRLVERYSRDPAELLRALGDFDEAVAAQAASLYTASSQRLEEPEFAQALKTAVPHVQRGFAAFAATQK